MCADQGFLQGLLLGIMFLPSSISQPSYILYEGDPCRMPYGEDGVCTPYSDCPSALFQRSGPINCLFGPAGRVVCCDPGRKSAQMCAVYGRPRMRPYVFRGRRVRQEEHPHMGVPFTGRRDADEVSYGIIRGIKVERQKYPHMAALGYRSEDGDGFGWKCGGSLISKRFILTAAHCIITKYGKPVVVRLGQLDLSLPATQQSLYPVADTIVPEKYTRRNKYNDIGLLKLARSVDISSDIKPACLYRHPVPPRIVTVLGWGATDSGGFMASDHLLEANLTVFDHGECSTFYSGDDNLPSGLDSSVVCAGDPHGGSDACVGDSGGPLQVKPSRGLRGGLSVVVGVTSFGSSPCGGEQPGVYTSVYHFLDWIEERVW